MCDKAILENGGTLNSIRNHSKVKKCVTKKLIITLMR